MRIKANGISMYYELSGSGKCLTLIHGGGGSNTSVWYNQVPAFSKHYQVLTYDFRGHGQTELRDGPISTEIWVEDLYALLNALNIKETVLLGHSLGGMIALSFVLTHPDMTRALILSNGGQKPGPRSEERMRQTQVDIQNRIESLQREGLKGEVERSFPNFFAPGFAEKNAETAERFKSLFLKTNLDGYIRTLRAFGMYNESRDGRKITCPTLIIAGEHDPYVGPEAGKAMQEAIPGSRLKILHTGHIPQVENPQEYNETVLGFLASAGLD
jgi:pimeloyl-ACP methyl ester carboxylesterase